MFNIKITLKPEARKEAIEMRKARGLEVPDDFEGPEFLGASDFSNADGWVSVELPGNIVYAYNKDTIARVKLTEA